MTANFCTSKRASFALSDSGGMVSTGGRCFSGCQTAAVVPDYGADAAAEAAD